MTEPTKPTPRRTRRPAAATGAPDTVAPAVAPEPQPPAPPANFPVIVEGHPGQDYASVSVGSLFVERGGIGDATADTVEVRMGGIGRLDAEDVHVAWGGIGLGRAETMSVEFGGIGAAMTGELRVTQGFAGNVVAREATVEQGLVRTLIAQHVTFSRPSGVLVLIAGRVDGDVRPVIDWRGALALGLGFGLLGALAQGLRRHR